MEYVYAILVYIVSIIAGIGVGFYFGYQKGRSSDGFSPEEKEMVRQVLSVLTYGGKRED